MTTINSRTASVGTPDTNNASDEVKFNQLINNLQAKTAELQRMKNSGLITASLADGLKNASFTAAEGITTLIGSYGTDSLFGNQGENDLEGRNGNDDLRGLGGADHLDGGRGIDTARYSDSKNGVTVNLATNINAGGDAEGDQLSNIENLHGSSYADHLTGDATANELFGAEGDDTLVGGLGNDLLNGGAGRDTVSYEYSRAGLRLDLQKGTARLGNEVDQLSQIENVIGTRANDTIIGNNANNVITGGAGRDSLTGKGGSDTFVFEGAFGSDVITDFIRGEDKLQFKGYQFSDLTQKLTSRGLEIRVGTNTVTLREVDAVLTEKDMNST